MPVQNARNHCHNRCKSASVVNTFSALRRYSENSFKCKCFGHSFDEVIAENNGDESPVNDILCPTATDPYKDSFEADGDLVNFLTESTLGLWTKVGGQNNDTDQRKNVCNPDRKIDLTTLYLARALGLSVSNIITNSIFDETAVYIFPNSSTNGPDQIFPPVDLGNFPNLEQTYWTIMSQYTNATEPTMRTRQRSQKWCWIVGKGVSDHCLMSRTNVGCSSCSTCCWNIWKNFVEACHRVHSLDTSSSPYKMEGNAQTVCLPTKPNLQLYEVSRV